MLDTYDLGGKFLGVKTRTFCHGVKPGVYHKPVWIWIKSKNGKILVQKRSDDKKENPGKWDMPSAGHVNAGESIIEACVRETKEELGIDVKESEFVFQKQIVNQEGWELAQVYILELDTEIDNFVLQKEEVSDVKWLIYNEFKKLYLSDDFCEEPIFYKKWVLEILK